jgi:hypothetical protein
MLMDLTRNYTRTLPNLTEQDRQEVLTLLKQMRMPVHYIRKKLKEEYRQFLAVRTGTEATRPRVSVKRLRENLKASYAKAGQKIRRDYLS